MKKKEKFTQTITGSNYNVEQKVLLVIATCIVLISFILRTHVFINVPDYTLVGLQPPVVNIHTYYKLMLMIPLVMISSMYWLYKFIQSKKMRIFDYTLVGTSFLIMGALISGVGNSLGLSQWVGYYTRTNGILAYILLFSLFYIVGSFTCSSKTIRLITNLFSAFSIFVTGLGTLQFLGYSFYHWSWVQQLILPGYDGSVGLQVLAEKNMAYSIFPHFNDYSSFCAIMAALFLVLYLREKERKQQILFGVTLLSLGVGIITSISEGGLITTFIVLAITSLLFFSSSNWKRLIAVTIGFLVLLFSIGYIYQILTFKEVLALVGRIKGSPELLGLCAIGLAVYACLFFIKIRLRENSRKVVLWVLVFSLIISFSAMTYLITSYAKNHEHLFTDRGYVWNKTAEMIEEHPIIGYGADNFFYAFPQNNKETKEFSDGQYYDKPHNTYLQVYMDTGLIGLAGFLILFIGSLLELLMKKNLWGESREEIYCAGIFIMIVAYLIQGTVFDNQITIQPSVYFLMAVGISFVKKKSSSI